MLYAQDSVAELSVPSYLGKGKKEWRRKERGRKMGKGKGEKEKEEKRGREREGGRKIA